MRNESAETCLFFGSLDETDGWLAAAIMHNPKCFGMVFREEGALDTGDSVPAVDYLAYGKLPEAGGIWVILI